MRILSKKNILLRFVALSVVMFWLLVYFSDISASVFKNQPQNRHTSMLLAYLIVAIMEVAGIILSLTIRRFFIMIFFMALIMVLLYGACIMYIT